MMFCPASDLVLACLMNQLFVAALDVPACEPESQWRDPDLFLNVQGDGRDSARTDATWDQTGPALSVPLTVLMAIHQFPHTQCSSNAFTVHIVGASKAFEGLSDWAVLWKARPSRLTKLTIDVIFAEVYRNELASCKSLDIRDSGFVVRCLHGWYPEVILDKSLSVPDMVFISSPGLPRLDRRTWDPAVRWLLKHNIPTVWSHMYWEHREVPAVSTFKPSAELLQSLALPIDYGGECEEYAFTGSTLSTYISALGDFRPTWDVVGNPYAIKHTEFFGCSRHTREEGEVCMGGILLNRALLLSGGVPRDLSNAAIGTRSRPAISSLALPRFADDRDRAVVPLPDYDAAAWVVAKLLIEQSKYPASVSSLAEIVGAGVPGWLHRVCKVKPGFALLLNQVLC